jgi:hypothetical protein
MEEVFALVDGKCVKRPVVHKMFDVTEPMDVHITREDGIVNIQHCRIGDILIVGDDHCWPVTKEYFAKHYDTVPLSRGEF